MTRLLMSSALAWALACGTAFGQASQDASTGAPAVSAQNSVKLVTVMAHLQAGTPYLTLSIGNSRCVLPRTQTWPGGDTAQNVSFYTGAFQTELERAGYKVVTPGDNLFASDSDSGSADYEAAAIVTAEHIEGCVSPGSSLFTHHEAGDVRGNGSMEVDWQIYSRLQKRVVARAHTSGTFQIDQAVPGGVQKLVTAVFAENVRELAQNADFRAAMSAPKAFSGGLQTPGQQDKILLAGSLKAGPRKIADAVGSVVTIMNDIGSGSGVLVSSDGYILTDAHVVGEDKQARVRWSDGIETLGQVVRVAKNRDVAIIKTDPRDRAPLAIKRGPVTPGQRVYAIGSPTGQRFEGTVSSGVISADRVIDGLRYIQSDTVVSHGSSGGPLLNERGEVIGLTDLGVQNDGPAGLNLFTPIGDAMDFLSLEQQLDTSVAGVQTGH
jgi:S1-C subfamily serine protease